uniref:Zinc finger, CCHC-type n=1 Tax=Tanacetum cinerariifolium TaxID=118510 RepID=A0A6L2KUL9_TANCI|nr:zinc finger, CCHC-type [Tanacetum cinerariifolium]
MPKLLEDATVEAIRIRAKWENDDYICRGHILNGMSDSLFDVYTNVESAKELWDSLESKYMAEDSSNKKFLVSNFNNYKMVDSRPVMKQYNELLRIFGQYTQHGLKMDESISVSSIIDKLPPSWKDFKHTLKHGKEVGGPSVNMTEEGGKNKHHKQNKGKKWSNKNNNGSSSNKKPKLECWKCGKTGYFKRDCRSGKKNNINVGGSGKGSKDNPNTKVDAIAWWIDFGATTHVCKDRCWFKTYDLVEDGSGCRAVVRLPDLKRKTLGEKSIDCIFVGYDEHSKAYRFYVIEPNDSISINLIIESRDAIFDENNFSSIPRPKDIIPNVQESQMDGHTNDVPNEIPEPRKDLRTYNEAMQSWDAAFWKEAIDDEIGSIMENNTWVLSDLPPGCKPLGCKWIFKRKMKVDGTIDKFKARSKSLSQIQVDQLEYSRAIGCLMYAMTSTRPDIAYVVGRLSRFTNNPSRQHWKAITRVFKYLRGTKDYGLSYVGYPSVLEGYSDAS